MTTDRCRKCGHTRDQHRDSHPAACASFWMEGTTLAEQHAGHIARYGHNLATAKRTPA